jgi:hypothetical protein
MGVVHVGWSTLDKRVREFSSAAASALTPKEFEAVAAATEEQTAQLLAHVVRDVLGALVHAMREGYCLEGEVGADKTCFA